MALFIYYLYIPIALIFGRTQQKRKFPYREKMKIADVIIKTKKKRRELVRQTRTRRNDFFKANIHTLDEEIDDKTRARWGGTRGAITHLVRVEKEDS